MKTNNLLKAFGLLACFVILPVFAAGGESGGGGDSLEERVNIIRADILKWINAGGARSLKLPADVSHEDYASLMTDILRPQKVVLGFAESEIFVGGIPKTCRSFISAENSMPHILCNIARFKGTSESDQYRLIHHEYAGLVRLERNDGAASDYEISSQLTDYLRVQTILRLAVINETQGETDGFDPLEELKEGQNNYNEAYSKYLRNLAILDETKKENTEITARLRDFLFPDAVIQKTIRACSENFSTLTSKFIKELTAENQSILDEATKNLKGLEYYFKVYTEARVCKQCEPHTRKKTMDEFKMYMGIAVNNILRISWQFKRISQTLGYRKDFGYCHFKQHFQYQDDERSRESDSDYEKTGWDKALSPQDIFNGTYDEALKFVGRNSPVQVYRTAPKFLDPQSSFDGKAVKIRMRYVDGFFNPGRSFKSPELINPIKIIQRDIK